MIIYTTQQHSLLSAILQTIASNNSYYYQSGRLEISRVNQIIPSMIARYELGLPEQERKK